MKKVLAAVVVTATFAADASACGGLFGRAAARRAAQASYATFKATPFYFAPAVAVPQVMPQAPAPVGGPDLEARVKKLERATAEAGRALLFQNAVEGPKAAAPAAKSTVKTTSTTVTYWRATYVPVRYFRASAVGTVRRAASAAKSVTYAPVAPVRRALTTLGSLGACPGGQCPAR